MIKYTKPQNWIFYDKLELVEALTDAKAAVMSLKSVPYQKDWVEKLQYIQLKREVAGTSRIEGADFTENEFEAALQNETAEQLFTRSQKQARAAMNTYSWIAKLDDDMPLNVELVTEIHRRLVTGADDDHCPPGELRTRDQNVIFGVPPHRGAEGGAACTKVFAELITAAQTIYSEHDPLIQALALHYHFAAIHPFLDGNGRTARAMEALLLQRVGLRDSAFIAMSNYYYDEKLNYLNALSISRSKNHNLTPFLKLGLRGITLQCYRLLAEINKHISKAIYRNLMFDLFNRLETKRKRVIAERQVSILKILLDCDEIEWKELISKTQQLYEGLKTPLNALIRDVNQLGHLGAIIVVSRAEQSFQISADLEWPSKISETDFMEKIKELPTAKTYPFL